VGILKLTLKVLNMCLEMLLYRFILLYCLLCFDVMWSGMNIGRVRPRNRVLNIGPSPSFPCIHTTTLYAELRLLLWRWWQEIPSKHWQWYITLHGTTSQNVKTFVITRRSYKNLFSIVYCPPCINIKILKFVTALHVSAYLTIMRCIETRGN
jgi:hypothetical protein